MKVINKVNDDSETILVASEDFFLAFSAVLILLFMVLFLLCFIFSLINGALLLTIRAA